MQVIPVRPPLAGSGGYGEDVEVDACRFESPHARLLKSGMWEPPTYDGLIAKGHDDLLVSAAMTAILDQQHWGQAESLLIDAPDPLQRYDRGAW